MNPYRYIYKQLENRVMDLSNYICFNDNQKNVYSLHIGDLILRCAVDIEAISKALYCRLTGKEKAVDEKGNDVQFDTVCIKLLNKEWHIDKKKICLIHPNMYFENRELVPLFNAEKKKENGSEWKQSYNAFKHSRDEEIGKANIWNMLNALGALYILNLYYEDESFWFETPMEKRHEYSNFSEVFEPALCDATKIGIGAQIDPEAISKLKEPTFEESIFILKYTDEAFVNMQKVLSDINLTIEREHNLKGHVDSFDSFLHSQLLPQHVNNLREAYNRLKNKEVILNKNDLSFLGININDNQEKS